MKSIWPPSVGILALASILLPCAATDGCRQGPWALWNAYASRFIDGQGRVIDPQGGDRTTSEGQSYALFFALVENDRPRFNHLLEWTQANLAAGNIGARLPGWLWGKTLDGQWKLLDVNSASDSDCWIAYTLLEAGRLWNEPTYTSLARYMMAMIAAREVADLPGFGSMLMPGPTALWVHGNTWTVNPSYLPVFIFDRFAEVDPSGPWAAIALNVPRLLRESDRRGFAMDWVNYVPGSGFSPAPPPGPAALPKPAASTAQPATHSVPAPKAETTQQAEAAARQSTPPVPAPAPKPPLGSYDAIRVYLWAGMVDGSENARRGLLDSLNGMAAYLADHGAPPEKVDAGGLPLPQDGPVGFSAAVLPYLRALAKMDKPFAQQRDRMSAQFVSLTGLYGNDPAYYDQNLTLFATGFLDGRFRFGARGELKVEWTRQ